MPPRLSGKHALLPISSLSGSIPRLVADHVFTPTRAFGIKSMYPPKPSRFNNAPGTPTTLATIPSVAHERKSATLPPRTGALAIKKGMTAIFDEDGKRIPCTILQLDRVQVISHKTRQKHGYFAVEVGCGWKHERAVTKPMLGHFVAHGVAPKRHIHEFRVKDESGLLGVGEVINADWFQEGQYVDARSNSRGMGFAGVMKRHGFHGQDRSHGVSLAHRSLGSAGQGQGGGSRVYPGKKMAGNMGNERVTIQNVKVLKVDAEKGIVVVNGCVAGPKGCIVRIQDALKKPWPQVPEKATETS
ncbi:54S ribosomal protein L9, mitochondrial [Onygenales sp. PD_40]|nr:54S ribosomal protein L9, mitochondrial [Onygenales sp. PD_40]KAK2782464.1 54S ribosomal protein L9, mitochondrial [Onygenales sp. PD_12]KAK2783350.1 54S ribosomal protein L9, mitochondrial [Emmonsiellopsis sp. PD_33]KAK2797021.1 54S ribosomal protein L9, mitochondrial [Onygenales sp. PD_10]